MKFSQQIKDRQEYTAFLSKGFYKDLIQELERLEECEELLNHLTEEATTCKS